MHSPTLGYVDATHQTLQTHMDRTVWTFYWALADGTATANRQNAACRVIGVSGVRQF